MNKDIIIAIDFDGSVVTHDYPRVGKDIGAVPVLRKILKAGHKIMLWTMRGTKPDNSTLADAIRWFQENDISLWGINENPDQKKTGWTNSNKQHAHIFIDDAALGCPLKFDTDISSKPFVDWNEVEKILKNKGLID